MTWTWTLAGLRADEQTLTVSNPDGEVIASETRESWNYHQLIAVFCK